MSRSSRRVCAPARGSTRIRKRLWPNRTVVLIGPSGAGKSSLANALIGSAALAIGEVRSGDHKGRHTTTSRQLVVVPTGGAIIDTPGLRAVGLVDDALDRVFPEIAACLGRCRFADCTHDGEPGCAIAEAIGLGRIDRDRFDSYRKLARALSIDGVTPQEPSPAPPPRWAEDQATRDPTRLRRRLRRRGRPRRRGVARTSPVSAR